jgi:hypothetical protein
VAWGLVVRWDEPRLHQMLQPECVSGLIGRALAGSRRPACRLWAIATLINCKAAQSIRSTCFTFK